MASLLRPHTDSSMRHDMDKECEAVDIDQLFDQYFETDLLHQLSNTTADPPSSDNLAHFFELPSSNGSDSFEAMPMPDWDTSVDSWHRALRKSKQDLAAPTVPNNSPSVYPRSRGKASLSDPALLDSEDNQRLERNQLRSHSQPPTPTPQTTRLPKKARSSPDLPVRPGVHKLQKKQSIPNIKSSMMRQSHYRAGLQDVWTRKMDSVTDTFNLQISPNGIHSPPPSSKFSDGDTSSGFFYQDQQPYSIAMSPMPEDPSTSGLNHSNYQLTPLSSPSVEQNAQSGAVNTSQLSSNHLAKGYLSRPIPNAALSALQTPPPSQRLPISTWGSETSPNLDFSFSASPEFQASSGKSVGWWGDSTTTTQPATPSNYNGSQSQMSSHDISNFSSESLSGLGINCDTSSFSGLGPELHMSANQNDGHSNSASSFDMSSYSNMYTHTHHTHVNHPHGIPIGQPRPRSNSRSLSPQPSFTRLRHPFSQSGHHNTRTASSTRRKSSNSSSHSHCNSRSGSGSGSVPGSGNVGFVNFTPDDSRKILGGVAPSGSSKTKARREKEAAEKRRKLSQAAMRAIMEAGGDIGRLEQEGLFVLEN